MNDKTSRLKAISRIVRSNQVSSQDDLMRLLKEEGIETTQATMSRDIKDLRIVKMHNASGGYVYAMPSEAEKSSAEVGFEITGETVLSLDFSGNLAVFKVLPGHAGMVAATIDAGKPRSAIGTVAGDDTVLVVIKEGVSRRRFIEEMSGLVHEIKVVK